MIQNGKKLSMSGDAIWKGTYTDNGTLLKLHENAYTIGYSALLAPDGTTSSAVKFGNGVFYDAKQKNNKVYVGAPTVADAAPKFAGVIAREPAIASGYPAINDEVTHFQKGLLIKEGYVIYKHVPVIADGATEVGEAKNAYDNSEIGFALVASAKDGTIYISPAKATKAAADDVVIGTLVELNPDDKSVTAYISPVFYA